MSIVDHVDVYVGDDGKWYWRAKAHNYEVVANGEGYERKIDAIDTIHGLFGEDVKIVERMPVDV